MNMTELSPLIIPLAPEAHRFAKELAVEQSTPEKGKRVYFNALAVCAVRTYLEGMGYQTDLDAGDSASPYVCGLLDATDLVLPGLGVLECRPVFSGETVFKLTMEEREGLIGYVPVQFEEQLDMVELLGFCGAFAPEMPPEVVEFSYLKPLDRLAEKLEDIIEELEKNKASTVYSLNHHKEACRSEGNNSGKK